jgi:hypothetical protein
MLERYYKYYSKTIRKGMVQARLRLELPQKILSNSKYEGVFFLVLYPDCQIRVLSAGFPGTARAPRTNVLCGAGGRCGNPAEP